VTGISAFANYLLAN